jgi:hypothetical protein
MTVDVKKISNRRQVRYRSLQELLTDVDQLAKGEVRTLGNRSFVEILRHLNLVMNNSIDVSNSTLRLPWYIRIAGRLLRKQILARGLQPGFQLPTAEDEKVWPKGGDVASAVEELHQAVHRLDTESKRGSHPAFGAMNVDEWNMFHLSHSQLHMSFVVPA